VDPRIIPTRNPAHAFERIQACLAGGPRAPLTPGASKALLFVLGGRLFEHWTHSPPADAEITETSFDVYFDMRRSKRPSPYVPSLAFPVVSELMTRADVGAILRPIVLGLPAGSVPPASYGAAPDFESPPPYPGWSYGHKLVWIVPGTEMVRLVVRPWAQGGDRPWSQEPPADGPLALPPELPHWAPEFLSLDAAVACLHCGSPAARYQRLAGAWVVCSRCGRPFTLR
jgi:hypothetical protein